jgi:hypothetical protein
MSNQIGDYDLAKKTLTLFADFDGLTQKDCEELGLQDEASETLREAIKDGHITRKESNPKHLGKYFTSEYIEALSGWKGYEPSRLFRNGIMFPLRTLGLTDFGTPDKFNAEKLQGPHGLLMQNENVILQSVFDLLVNSDRYIYESSTKSLLAAMGPEAMNDLFDMMAAYFENPVNYDSVFTSELTYGLLSQQHSLGALIKTNFGETFENFGEPGLEYLAEKLEQTTGHEQMLAAMLLGSFGEKASPVVPRILTVFSTEGNSFWLIFQLATSLGYIADERGFGHLLAFETYINELDTHLGLSEKDFKIWKTRVLRSIDYGKTNIAEAYQKKNK